MECMAKKASAPASDLNVPEIFCLTFSFLMPLSLELLSEGISGSSKKLKILDYIYGSEGIKAVDTPVGKECISIGSLTLRCPAPATLCDLQGRQVRPEHTGIGLLFRVPRHGVYLLRTRKDGRQVARKIAL